MLAHKHNFFTRFLHKVFRPLFTVFAAILALLGISSVSSRGNRANANSNHQNNDDNDQNKLQTTKERVNQRLIKSASSSNRMSRVAAKQQSITKATVNRQDVKSMEMVANGLRSNLMSNATRSQTSHSASGRRVTRQQTSAASTNSSRSSKSFPRRQQARRISASVSRSASKLSLASTKSNSLASSARSQASNKTSSTASSSASKVNTSQHVSNHSSSSSVHSLYIPTFMSKTTPVTSIMTADLASASLAREATAPIINEMNDIGNNVSVLLGAPFNDVDDLKVGQSGMYNGYKITRVNVPQYFNYFCIVKTCRAHNDIASVGSKRNYGKVLKPRDHATFLINRVFKIRQGHKSIYRYEFSAKAGKHYHNYFVPGDSRFVRNAYIQPHEMDHAHGLLRHYYRVQTLLNAHEYRRPVYSRETLVKSLKKGTVLRVKRVINVKNNGHYRTFLQLTNGDYVTANRNFVKLV